MKRDAIFCSLCGEPILDGEPVSPSLFNGKRVHHECGFRAVAGGANHILGNCTCCGGTLPPDPPGLTKREAARAAVDAWTRKEKLYDVARQVSHEAGFDWTDPRTGETHPAPLCAVRPAPLNLWTIYDHPSDFPGGFIARRYELDKPTTDMRVADTLEEIRERLPPGLYCLARNEGDDPKIVETWL